MRRTSIYSRGRRGDLKIEMTTMIDVVFLLLVFFVWTASFQIVEHTLPSNLSAIQGTQPTETNDPPPPEEDFDDVIIRILWNGNGPTWRVNDSPAASLDDVRGTLSVISGIKPDAPVILHPDPQVPLGHVIDVYDLSRLEGFQKVQFAASEDI